MDATTGGTGEEELHLPSGLLEFQTDEDSVISVMSWPNQNKGRAWIGEKRLEGFPCPIDGFAHQILQTMAGLEAFFLPGSGLGWG